MTALSRLSVCVLLFAACRSAESAGVEGRVILRGTPPPEIVITMSGDCAAAQKQLPTTRHYVVGKDGGLANVLVVMEAKHLKAGSVRKEIGVHNGRVDPLQFELHVPPGS